MSDASNLLALQETDLELLRRASKLKAMPQVERLDTIKKARRKVASELTSIVGQRKDAETELSDTKAELAHYQEITQTVQARAMADGVDYRRMRDYESQLSSLAKNIEKCEYTISQQEESLERLRRAEQNAIATLDRLDDERDQTQASLDAETSDLRAEISQLTGERQRLTSELSPDVLEWYERERKHFKGLAVESLNGNVPTTCRVKLQPSLYHDLARGPEITECPYCHRILVVTIDRSQA